MKINELNSTLTSNKKRKRRGRGAGSGLGKTAGRGVKGQKSRSGVSINGFEGGQMPIHRRLPKRGFTNINRVSFIVLNFDRIENLIKDKKIDPNKIVNSQIFLDLGIVKSEKSKIKLLAKGEIKTKIKIEVDAASTSAKDFVQKIGGSVTVIENKKLALKASKKAGA